MIHITSLPRADAYLEVQALPRTAKGVAGRPDTVLIIEDDATMRLALACMVADAHRQVVLARSADDALERMPLVDPDIVICDLLMDGMNGREFCQRMKSARRWRHVPILVVTRMDEQPIITDLLKSGADDVLVKPVHPGELRARLVCRLRTRMRHPEHGDDLGCVGSAISVIA
jgi:DNA-binding response OmpR family regulator